jgi:hypothetical protein
MKPSTSRVLARLVMADGAWISGNRLFEVGGTRYGARLYELRHEHGIDWEKRYVNGTRVPQYRLVPADEQQSMGLAS